MAEWHVVFTANQAETKRILESYPEVTEVYCPVAHKRTKNDSLGRASSLVHSYVFVRSTRQDILRLVRLHSSFDLKYVSDGETHRPMVIPDNDMQKFKIVCEANLELMWLHDPYAKFQDRERVRVLSGPFTGFEGFLKEIKKSYCLVTKLMGKEVAIPNIHKYDVAIVSHGTKFPEVGRVARIADYIITQMGRTAGAGQAHKLLRLLVQGVGRCQTVDQYRAELDSPSRQRAKKDWWLRELEKSAADEVSALKGYMETMSDDDKELVEHAAAYIYSKDADPCLERILPETSLRPFLTRTPSEAESHEEFCIPIDMKEGVYDLKADATTEKTSTYYAHVCKVAESGAPGVLITNWSYFYSQFRNKDKEAKLSFIEKLRKYDLRHFLSCLDGDSEIHFMELTADGGHVAGLGMRLPADTTDEEMQKAVAALVETGK